MFVMGLKNAVPVDREVWFCVAMRGLSPARPGQGWWWADQMLWHDGRSNWVDIAAQVLRTTFA
jgi:hypothetical protein